MFKMGLRATAILALLVFACDSGTSTSPSVTEEAGSNSFPGAELVGSFAGTGGSSTLKFSRGEFEGITVRVVDAGISGTVGPDGNFVLEGLPSGSFTVRFIDMDGKRIGELTFQEVFSNMRIILQLTLGEDGGVELLKETREIMDGGESVDTPSRDDTSGDDDSSGNSGSGGDSGGGGEDKRGDNGDDSSSDDPSADPAP